MTPEWRPSADLAMLRARARLLRDIRRYFAEAGVLEVETPVLSQAAVTDPAIHSMQLAEPVAGCRFLHTSPEFPMKRLLCAGTGDIYQICRVFRGAELGRHHNPEFTLLEWYRLGYDMQRLMTDVEQLLRSVLPSTMTLGPSRFLSYEQAIFEATGLSLARLDIAAIQDALNTAGVPCPPAMPNAIDPWLDLLMSSVVTPQFSDDRLTFIYHYPASQASLARLNPDNPSVAERFEVYIGPMELGNGFHELQDADEQRARFQSDLAKRQQLSLPAMPMDTHLLDALGSGLPDCAGVAVGLDRVLMAFYTKTEIADVISFGAERA
ncbi:MAG TPA: EF-P lysine aminoacylase GenX [Gammaproteobacteria bacterium]|jgi:lysyl-tRNA synthetase class 2|nr:EF-P lysine aminoacylase GenX [Gammaproteobacteria bacterium]